MDYLFNLLCLKFSDEHIEEEFRTEYFTKSLKKHRAALLIGTFLYAAFGFLDWIVIPENYHVCWLIRFCIVCPLLLWTYFLSYSKKYRNILKSNALFVGHMTSMGLIAIITIASPPGNHLYYAGLLLCVLFYYEFIPDLTLSNILVWSSFCIYITTALLQADIPWIYLFNNTFILLAFNITGLFISYSLESSQRSEFLQRRTIRLQADQLSRALREVDLERRRAEELSLIDPLTGLANRRHFFTAADHEIRRKNRLRQCLSAMLLDIDRFKAVNDTHGHAIGDHVLQKVATTIAASTRGSDLVCRYGGEEFAILLPETNFHAAVSFGTRLIERIANMEINTEKGSISVTVSMGIAALDEDDAETIDILLERADQALYVAKNAGRNQLRAWRLLPEHQAGVFLDQESKTIDGATPVPMDRIDKTCPLYTPNS